MSRSRSRSNVTSLDWPGYPIIRFKDAQTFEVILLDNPNLPATGSGEPSVNPIAPAIGNAVSDRTGMRVCTLPMRPSWVRAAFAQQRR